MGDIMKDLSELLNSLEENKKLISNLESKINELNNNVRFFNNYSPHFKRYFFKDQEKSLKKFLNTEYLFQFCYLNNIEFLSYSPNENKLLLKNKNGTILATTNRYYNILEVFAFDSYSVPQLYEFEDFVVFDIGMNRGYSTLRFAEFNNCSKVYGFEIDEITYKKAEYHKKLNPQLAKKIKLYNFGLLDKNNFENLYFLKGADTLSTLEENFVNIEFQLKAAKDDVETKLVEVKKASEVIKKIIDEDNITSKIVLKLDTEGSEYKIINDLIDSGIIYYVDLILGEGHKFCDEDFDEKLKNLGFKLLKRVDFEIVYNFAYVKDEFFDKWLLKE